MEYINYEFLFPPRPETALPSSLLKMYERKGWIAQFKKNGTGGTIAISPDKQFTCKTRHGDNHKLWQIDNYIKGELIRLFPEKCWIYLICEVMHSKTKTVKNTIYIHDILVFNNEFLFDTTFIERQEKILNPHLKDKAISETISHYVCDKAGQIWFAKLHDQGFSGLFFGIEDQTIDEGLVLKNPQGKLASCNKEVNRNKIWQVKFRHAKKNYSF